jgi:hypothetical protein
MGIGMPADQHAPLVVWLQQLQQDLAHLLVLAPSDSDANDSGGHLVTVTEGARAVNAPYKTIWRWANDDPEALGVQRFGGKLLLSMRKLRFFVHRQRTKV